MSPQASNGDCGSSKTKSEWRLSLLLSCLRCHHAGLHGSSLLSVDSMGVHRVENPSHSDRAISLHLYSPPFESCNLFDVRTGHKRPARMTFWSRNGQLQLSDPVSLAYFVKVSMHVRVTNCIEEGDQLIVKCSKLLYWGLTCSKELSQTTLATELYKLLFLVVVSFQIDVVIDCHLLLSSFPCLSLRTRWENPAAFLFHGLGADI